MGDRVPQSPNGPAYNIYRFPHEVQGNTCYLVPADIPIYTEQDAIDHMRKMWWEEASLAGIIMEPTRLTEHVIGLVEHIQNLYAGDWSIESVPDLMGLREELKRQIKDAKENLERVVMSMALNQRPHDLPLWQDEHED